MQRTAAWMRDNLTTQGYCLSDVERRELAVGLRFSTGLTLVVVALVLVSPAMIFALSVIGVIAGFTARHPFDHIWNRAARHVLGGPPLPPNPTRRRHAFKVATVWARRRHAARRWRHDGRTDPRQDARRGLCGRDCREFLRALRGARHVGAPPARPTHHQLRSTSP